MLSNKKVKKDNTEEEKMIAEKLNEAISKAEEEKADEDLADDELTLLYFSEGSATAVICFDTSFLYTDIEKLA
jgi:hypothetical protein